jgi:hydrogenase maturation protein HypF
MALEFAADPAETVGYPFPLVEDRGLVLDWRPLLVGVLDDLANAIPIPAIAARFHNGLVGGIAAVANAAGEPRVALTGGVFQNRLLTERTVDRLGADGFEVLLHRVLPPNDGGIAAGQAAVAAAQIKTGGLLP